MRRLVPASWIRLGVILPALLSLAATVPLRADNPPASSTPFAAEAVRAAYLVNFIRFTEWPADALPPTGPFVIGIAGSRALEDEIIRLADRQLIRERRLRVVRIKAPRDLDACHVVYFDPSMQAGEEPSLTAAEALPLLRDRPVLTVSESSDFLARGGVINLYRDGGNLRFEISPDTARARGLVLSSRLLALARIVHPPAPDTSSTDAAGTP